MKKNISSLFSLIVAGSTLSAQTKIDTIMRNEILDEVVVKQNSLL